MNNKLETDHNIHWMPYNVGANPPTLGAGLAGANVYGYIRARRSCGPFLSSVLRSNTGVCESGPFIKVV